MIILRAKHRRRHFATICEELFGLVTAVLDSVENSVLAHGLVGQLVYLILSFAFNAMFKLIFHFFLVVLEIVTATRQPY